MQNTPENTQARLDAGLSFADIAKEYGTTKDQVRGSYTRWKAKQAEFAETVYTQNIAASGLADLIGAPAPQRTMQRQPLPGLNFGWFDLESTNLNGSFGRLHCGACAHSDGSVWMARIDDPGIQNKREKSDDFKLAVAIRDHLETHDILFSWNGRRGMNPKGRGGFDTPMLNARLVPQSRILRSSSQTHIDLLPIARRHLQLHSYRLAAVQGFLELVEEKTAITPRIWRLALDHDKGALDYIADHCRRDVLVLKEVYEDFLRVGMLEIAVRVAKS